MLRWLLNFSSRSSVLHVSCRRDMAKSRIAKQLIAGLAVTISAVCVGFNVGWSAPSLVKLLADDSDIPITSEESSWIVSFFSFGCILSAVASAAVVDKCGRKLCLLFTVIPQIGSCMLIGLAQSYWWFNVARFVGGFASGITMTVVPMYLGEIAEDRIRGALGTTLTVMLNAGILSAYCVGPWVNRTALAGFGGAIAIVFGLIFVWMPESPYFLTMKGNSHGAEKSLLWLLGKESVNEELIKVQKSVEFDRKNAATIKDLVMVPGNRKALIILLGLVAAQQLSGINAVLSYSNLIFEASGSKFDSSISVIIIGVVQLFSGMLTLFTIDFTGRRPLLLTSFGGSAVFLAGEALYFHLQAMGSDDSGISWLPVTAMVGYIIFYVFGLGCIPHVVLSEIFPCNVKASAAMVCTSTASIAGIIVAKVYQIVADEYGIHVAFWGFVAITVFFGILFYFILPETKQRSLKSIQEEFHKTTEPKVQLKESNTA